MTRHRWEPYVRRSDRQAESRQRAGADERRGAALSLNQHQQEESDDFRPACASDPADPDRPAQGLTTYDAKDPNTSFPPIEPLLPPTGAPNVLVVLLDDVGFGA